MTTVEQQYIDAIHAAGNTGLTQHLEHILDQQTNDERARLEHPGALRGAALWYARRDIAVFPCHPQGKQPATRNGFKDATTDLDQIRAWWDITPDANIGIPTGRSFDVIDVDGYDGVISMWAGPTPLAETLTILGHVSTPRHGGHHLYVPVTGHGNKAAIYPGIDYRGRGGYVIAPPSAGPDGTARYRWIKPLQVGE